MNGSTVVRSHGGAAVVPGNWNQGVIKYKDRLYAFRGAEEAKRFVQNPEGYAFLFILPGALHTLTPVTRQCLGEGS